MVWRSALGLGFSLLASVAAATQISQFTPTGKVSVVESVKITFDAPVITFGDGQAAAPIDLVCDGSIPSGQGRWLSANRWTYVFDQTLGPGMRCTATVKPDFRTLKNEALRGKQSFAFSTGGPQVVDSRPFGSSADEDQVFVLRFNGPVKPDTLLAHTHCAVEGLGEAVPVRLIQNADEREVILDAGYVPDDQRTEATQLVQCKRLLPAEAQLQLVVGPGVSTVSGMASTRAQSFAYTVRAPFLASFSCLRENANAPCTPVRPITLSFNAPISKQVAEAIRLKTPDGEVKPLMRAGEGYENSVDRVVFDAPFAPEADLTLTLPDNLKDDAGRALANADQFPLVIHTANYPPLVKFSAAPFGIVERFGYTPDGASEDDYPPSVPLTIRNVDTPLKAGDLTVGAGTVHDYVPKDDVDVLLWYASLARLENWQWTPTQLKNILAGRAPGQSDEKDIDVRGISVLKGKSDVRRLELPVLTEGDSTPLEVIGIPLAQPGFHVLEVESRRLGASLLESKKPMYVRSSVLVTNLSVSFKQGRDDALAWVTTLDTGEVVPDAAVNVLDCRGTLLASGRTDENGLWHWDAGLGDEEYCEDTGLSGFYVSARIPAGHPMARGKADFSFALSGWDQGIESWRFNVPTDNRPEPTLITHTVFDRSLYRAGETVHMKHFARTQTRNGLAIPDKDALPRKMLIDHQGSDQRYTHDVVWKPTASGGLYAESTFELPKTARLGVYAISLVKSEDDYAMAEAGFRVEEFKLPVLAGTLKISEGGVQDQESKGNALGRSQGVLIAPAQLHADVQINYVSGGPAGKLPVTLSGVLRDTTPSFADYDDFSFRSPQPVDSSDGPQGDRSENRLPDDGQVLFLNKQAMVLDANGGGRLQIASTPSITRPGEMLFEAGFADPNGEIQTLSQLVTVLPAARVAGIQGDDWVVAGKGGTVTALALSPDGRPQAGVEISIKAIGRTVYSTRKRLVGGFYSYDNQTSTRDLGTVCQGISDEQGKLQCSFDFQESGSVEMVAALMDEQGRVAQAAYTLWVVGSDDLWFGGGNDDRIDIIADKAVYQPGDTAKIQVRMPFREATALVAVEREGVLQTRVVQLSGADPSVQLPIQPEWGPNVYVSVLVLRGRVRQVRWQSFFEWGWKQPGAWLAAYQDSDGGYEAPTAMVDLSKPAFRFGLTRIRVTDAQDQLHVTVQPDQASYQVRGKAQVAVQVTTPDGKPASGGQIAFVAVDQALLELAPNPSWDLFAAMHPQRSYGVRTATAQMEVIGRRHYGRKALPAGGGGGKSPTRELLDTLLVWMPAIQLDEQGRARVDVPLNDSITRFELVAIASHGANRFGTGRTSIAVTQDLQLISGLPALVREGDRYQAAVTVRNSTTRVMQVAVDLAAEGQGKRLPEQALEPRTAQIDAGQAATLNWEVLAPALPGADASATIAWRLQAREVGAPDPGSTGGEANTAKASDTTLAADNLRVSQALVPAVPVNVTQATIERIGQNAAVQISVAPPPTSLRDRAGAPRGGIQATLQSSLAAGLPGVVQWFENYPYTCLEQQASQAIGLSDPQKWQALMRQLPDYLDGDGLARYFPGSMPGDEVLTAYLLSASRHAQALGLSGFSIPDATRERMMQGLLAFVQGRIVRQRWSPGSDLDSRKLMALEALSGEGKIQPRLLGSIVIAPDRWPTATVVDWLAVLHRVGGIANRDVKISQANTILRARLLDRGVTMVPAGDALNDAWWLMAGPEATLARLMLTVAGQAQWRADMPRLAQGLLSLQRKGAWSTTTSNLMGTLALRQFAQRYERDPIQGQTRLVIGHHEADQTFDWPVEASAAKQAPVSHQVLLPWASSQSEDLMIEHSGSGNGWAFINALAAVPVEKAVSAGYALTREVIPVTQANPPEWSRGDVYRVKLTITSRAPTIWAVISDPIPAGATILGSGLGRDSAIAASANASIDAAWSAAPSFVERAFAGYRAYFDYLPTGRTQLEYVVRLNTVGDFNLPPTRAEALYQPEIYGMLPGTQLSVQAQP